MLKNDQTHFENLAVWTPQDLIVRFAIFIMYERVLIYRTCTWSFFNHDVIFLFVSRTKAGATAN